MYMDRYATTAHTPTRQTVTPLFLAGVVVSALALAVGYYIEEDLYTLGIRTLIEGQDPRLLLVMAFSFGIPLGFPILLLAAMRSSEGRGGRLAVIAVTGLLLVSLPYVVPELFGWETGRAFFGIGGALIYVGVAVSTWYWGHHRRQLPETARKAADLKALGYLCFAMAAWGVCGLTSMPSFGLHPQTMLDQGVRPFAVGQAKAVMVYFVLGWLFTALGIFKSART